MRHPLHRLCRRGGEVVSDPLELEITTLIQKGIEHIKGTNTLSYTILIYKSDLPLMPFNSTRLQGRYLVAWPSHRGQRGLGRGITQPSLHLLAVDCTTISYSYGGEIYNASPRLNCSRAKWQQKLQIVLLFISLIVTHVTQFYDTWTASFLIAHFTVMCSFGNYIVNSNLLSNPKLFV